MKFSTPLASRSLIVATMLATGALFASAQTFVQNGIIYKVNKANVEVQKVGTKLTDDSEKAPEAYTGAIKLPAKITYNGKEYGVSKFGSAFKGTEITSFELEAGSGVKLERGAFQGCAQLVSVTLPGDISSIAANVFQDCVALPEITIPGSVEEIPATVFTGCTSLKKMVIADGETPLAWQATTFGETSPLEEVVMNRDFNSKYAKTTTLPFRGNANIKKATIGGHCTSLPESFFENATNLTDVTFTGKMESLGLSCFANTGLTEFTFPEGPVTVPGSAFANCKQLTKVTLPDAVTTISALAFANTGIEAITLPAELKSIGVSAFSGSALKGELVLPENVKTIDNQAFANTALTAVSLPAATATIGAGAFMGCADLAKFTVAVGNETYVSSPLGDYIMIRDGQEDLNKINNTLVVYAPATAATEFTGTFPAVADYAFYGAKNLKTLNLTECQKWGDYCLYGSGIEKIALPGAVGRYAVANCANLTELTIGTPQVPFGVAADCPELATVNFTAPVTVVKQDAFKNCPKVTSLDLGSLLAILESDCFAGSGLKDLKVGSYYPAAMAEGVFKEGDEITVTVPESLVEAYKTATGWSYLTIKGDANIAVGGEDMGMPDGLYYAGDDGDLHCVYADGQDDTYPMGLSHTFQLVEFSHRIYGASAGKVFWWTPSADKEGDGVLFYISKIGDNTFQATVLDNAGNNAYKDPFGLYIYGSTLYVNDRNVCIRKISADAIALPQNYESWMENNWMGWYDNGWTYGCIKNGFAITKDQDADGNEEPRFWVGMKYNGFGLFSFKEGNIGSSSEKGSLDGTGTYFSKLQPIATCFNIDEKNGDLYMYFERGGLTEANHIKGGLYRIKLENLAQYPDPTVEEFFNDLGAELIDGAPVKYEGSAGNEHVGISQLAIDENGEYMYWCYRAPTPEEAAAREEMTWEQTMDGKYWWAENYDENNPLHKSGIKRIKLGEEKPVVEMVAEGVTGYGVVPVKFENSKKPDGINAVVNEAPAAELIAKNGAEIVALQPAQVSVYNAAGLLVATASLAEGQAFDTAALPAGLYVVEATTAAAKQALKVVK